MKKCSNNPEIQTNEVQEKYLVMKSVDKHAKNKIRNVEVLDKKFEDCKRKVADKEEALRDYNLQKNKLVEVNTVTIWKSD